MFKVQLDRDGIVHLTRPKRFKEDTLTSAILTTQEATFKIQLDRDRRVHLTRPEESVLPNRQSDTAKATEQKLSPT